MKQIYSIRDIILIIFAAIVLTGIYLNLKIMLNQTFFQLFEGTLDLNIYTLILFLIFLGFLQYLIQHERPFIQKNNIKDI